MKRFEKNNKSKKYAIWTSFGISLVPWLVVNVGFWILVHYVPSVREEHEEHTTRITNKNREKPKHVL